VNRKLIIATAAGLLASLGAFAPSALAQAQKLAVMDMQSALINTKDGQKAVNDLRAKYAPKDAEMQKRQQEVTAKQDQYRKTQNTISEAAKTALERDIESLTRALQRDSDDARQDMEADQQRILQELGAKMIQVINKYAADNGITAVFDVSGQPNNILFASTASDITAAVVALYDKAAPAAPPAAAPTSSAPAQAKPPAPAAPKPATPAAKP
jgi:Skp family chaperone for outer membrane proteins